MRHGCDRTEHRDVAGRERLGQSRDEGEDRARHEPADRRLLGVVPQQRVGDVVADDAVDEFEGPQRGGQRPGQDAEDDHDPPPPRQVRRAASGGGGGGVGTGLGHRIPLLSCSVCAVPASHRGVSLLRRVSSRRLPAGGPRDRCGPRTAPVPWSRTVRRWVLRFGGAGRSGPCRALRRGHRCPRAPAGRAPPDRYAWGHPAGARCSPSPAERSQHGPPGARRLLCSCLMRESVRFRQEAGRTVLRRWGGLTRGGTRRPRASGLRKRPGSRGSPPAARRCGRAGSGRRAPLGRAGPRRRDPRAQGDGDRRVERCQVAQPR